MLFPVGLAERLSIATTVGAELVYTKLVAICSSSLSTNNFNVNRIHGSHNRLHIHAVSNGFKVIDRNVHDSLLALFRSGDFGPDKARITLQEQGHGAIRGVGEAEAATLCDISDVLTRNIELQSHKGAVVVCGHLYCLGHSDRSRTRNGGSQEKRYTVKGRTGRHPCFIALPAHKLSCRLSAKFVVVYRPRVGPTPIGNKIFILIKILPDIKRTVCVRSIRLHTPHISGVAALEENHVTRLVLDKAAVRIGYSVIAILTLATWFTRLAVFGIGTGLAGVTLGALLAVLQHALFAVAGDFNACTVREFFGCAAGLARGARIAASLADVHPVLGCAYIDILARKQGGKIALVIGIALGESLFAFVALGGYRVIVGDVVAASSEESKDQHRSYRSATLAPG